MSKVSLVAVTKSVLPDMQSSQDLVAYVARVSNPSNQNNSQTAPKLLKYLAKHNHWSPFEMVNLVMQIDTTRDIARQILRHRSFAFQEFSQRYADAGELGFETREARLQDLKNRQASVENSDRELDKIWEAQQSEVLRTAKRAYTWALTNGIAKEQARAVLPEGITHSRLYMNGTLRSWIHYCEVRCDISTQKEHREIAEQCKEIILGEFPSLEEILAK